MNTDSFYYSYMMLDTCMVAKGNLTQLLQMTKNSTYKHVFIICLVLDFSLAHRCRRSNPCERGRYIHITSACKSLTKSGTVTVLAFCFWTAGKKKMVLCMVIMFLSLLFNPAMPYCCFLVSLLLSNTCLVVLIRLFFQV